MKKIILLDMDGTITPPRKPIQIDMIQKLDEILSHDIHLGVVTGSNLEYMQEQLNSWEKFKLAHRNIHSFPCNGLEYWRNCKCVYRKNMKDEYTGSEWNWLIHDIHSADKRMRLSLGGKDIRVPEKIIQERGSMINWCPIGRDANDKDRAKFIEIDKKHKLRENFLNQMKTRPLFTKKTVIKLGGETSFDIFPSGWDKSYAFKNFENFDSIYFIGDRCGPMGNDFEGYRAAAELGFETTGPTRTIAILSEILSGATSNN